MPETQGCAACPRPGEQVTQVQTAKSAAWQYVKNLYIYWFVFLSLQHNTSNIPKGLTYDVYLSVLIQAPIPSVQADICMHAVYISHVSVELYCSGVFVLIWPAWNWLHACSMTEWVHLKSNPQTGWFMMRASFCTEDSPTRSETFALLHSFSL